MDPDDLDSRLSALRDAPLPTPLAPASLVRARGDRRRQRARAVNATAVVALVAGAAIASASLLGESGTSPGPNDVASPDASVTMLTEEPEPTPSASATASDARDFGFIREIRQTPGGGYVLVFDRATFLTGEQAKAAKAAAGQDPEEPPDYFIENNNPMLRELPVADDVQVLGSIQLAGASPEGTPVTFERLREYVAGGGEAPFDLRYEGDEVIEIAERYIA